MEGLIIIKPEHETGTALTRMAILACMTNLSSCSGIRNIIVVDDRKPHHFVEVNKMVEPIELIPSPSVMMSGKEARRLRRKNNKNK